MPSNAIANAGFLRRKLFLNIYKLNCDTGQNRYRPEFRRIRCDPFRTDLSATLDAAIWGAELAFGDVINWQGHPPDQVKAMNHALAKLREQGINSLNDEPFAGQK